MDIILYSDMLIANAQKKPDTVAVIAADETYTYEGLNKAANRFANGLLARGVKAGDRVMVALPKDSTPFVAMFGIMKIGAALIPVSMDYPQARIDSIREDSDVVLMVGTKTTSDMVAFDEIFQAGDENEPVRPAIDGSAVCMVLYTSGSTGKPKGVQLRHQGFVETGLPYPENLLSYRTMQYGHTFLGVTTTTFAFFYMEYCFCLANGCTYVMADHEHSRSPMLMAELASKYHVDVLSGTPSRILQYLEIPVYAGAFENCHILVIGGERVPFGMPEAVHKIAPDCHILNGYSQTEGNGPMIVGEVESEDTHGIACHGWQLLVVDPDNHPTAPGTPGELLMAGPNMMEGYVKLPEEMAAKTVEIDGISYFRTGDLVNHFEDGGYQILGRMDRQIKLRGLRMEPGEIEKVIQAYPDGGIEAVVVKVNVIHHAEHLVAYYTGSREIAPKDLKNYLRQSLTAYMVPDYYMYLEKFPLNPNGKVDYKNLPEFDLGKVEIVAPKDEIEESILEECKRILDYDEFGVTQPLEEVGFTSLLYIQLASMVLDNYRVELKLTDLMAGGATVRTLAEMIRKADLIAQDSQEKLDRYPLTPQLYQFTAKNPVADMFRRFDFAPVWSAEKVRDAFLRIFNSFPYLYTTIRKEDGEWVQIPYTGEMLSVNDIPIIDGEPGEEEIQAFCKPYDLQTADRLFDFKVYRGEKTVVLMHLQHILMDHVFVERLIGDIRAALKNPKFKVSEDTDYFAYTARVNAGKEGSHDLHDDFMLSEQPHPVQSIETIKGILPRGMMDPILKKYHLQISDYVFGLIGEAYLEVMGEDQTVFYNIFGGRNEARYFGTAGYFPMRVSVPVQKDARFYENVGARVVDAFSSVTPWDDLAFRIMEQKKYPYPNLSYNYMEYIEENEDFSLVSLFAADPTYDDMAKALTPHMDFMCLNIGITALAIVLNFDPAFISAEKAQEILDKVKELAEACAKTVED